MPTATATMRHTGEVPRQITREPAGEELASRRIRHERERRGWSTAELARQVTEAGCKINQSSVWAIESGEPQRRISLDEAVAFAKVFGLTLDDLMTAPDDKRASFTALVALMRGLNELKADAEELAGRIGPAVADFRDLAGDAALALQYLERDGIVVPTEDVLDTLAGLAEALLDLREAIAQNPLNPATDHAETRQRKQ